jgi:formylglycine-generating enzyme required for sulfatase activity
MVVFGALATNMILVSNYTWEAFLESAAPLTNVGIRWRGVSRTNPAITNVWGETNQTDSAFRLDGTAEIGGANVILPGTNSGQFVLTFNETNRAYIINHGYWENFDAWDYTTTARAGWESTNGVIITDPTRILRNNSLLLGPGNSVRSAFLQDGIGEVVFSYRNYQTNGLPPTALRIQKSVTGSSEDADWFTLTNLLTIAAVDYGRAAFTVEDRNNRYIRLQNTSSNGFVALDEIRIHDPYFSGVVGSNLTVSPASPTATNPVTVSLDLQPFSGASDIRATLYYRLGGETTYTSISLTNTSGFTYTTVTPIPANLVPDYWGYRVEYYIRCAFTGDQSSITSPVDVPAGGSNNPAFYDIQSDIARVTLNHLTQTYNGSNRIVTASTLPTGLVVEITYDGNMAAPVNAGSYFIIGTLIDSVFQGTQTGTLVVAKADQAIDFPVLEAQSTNATVILQAIASSGLPVTFAVGSGPGIITDGTQLTFNATGLVSIVANQDGDLNWNPAPSVTRTLTVLVDCPYLVIDLSGGSNAVSYPLSYLAAVPSGGWTDDYKTTKMVLRLIPGGTFTMGSPANELGRYYNETQHWVTVTQPFYIGVFEVTQKQWERVVGTWPSYFTNASYRDSRPVEQVSYYQIRENPNNTDDPTVNWPTNRMVNAQSFMGKLRVRTGKTFDLPTESQWEYAGRAGMAMALNSGCNITNLYTDARLAEVGRYWYNGGSRYTQTGDTSVATAKVGAYRPNAWGLYDIHGNVWEWCLDWYGAYPAAVENVNPAGAISGSGRVDRGGGWDGDAYLCRVAYRNYSDPRDAYRNIGFRVAWILNNLPQSISFDPLGPQPVDTTLTLSATASSGLPVSFTNLPGSPVQWLNATQIVFTGTGTVAIVASQLGNESWAAAAPVTHLFDVVDVKITALVSLNTLNQTYNGSNRMVTASTVPPGLSVDLTYNGEVTPPINAGSYAIVGTVNDSIYQGTQTGTLVVAKGDQTIIFPNPGAQIATHTVGLTATAGSGLPVTFLVLSGPGIISDGSNLFFTGAGSVALVASQEGDSNWNPAAPITHILVVTINDTAAFFRIVSSTTSVITAFSPDGVMVWSNAAVGDTGCIQWATTVMGDSNWMHFAGFTVTGALMSWRLFDSLIPSSGRIPIPAGINSETNPIPRNAEVNRLTAPGQ